MSRNSANLTYTYYSEDGSVMEDPKCHKCMNRRFHEHALHDVSTVYVNTLAGPIPFLIRSLIFSNGDEKPFTLRSIHENLVVLQCTDEFHSSGDDSAKNAIKINNSAAFVPKESGLENSTVSTRKRKADEPEVVKEASSPSSSIYKKPCKLRQWEPVDSATRVVGDHDGFGKTLVASADRAGNTASSVHKSELLVTSPSQKFTLFRGKPKNESKELSIKECAEQFFANFYANGLFSGGLTHQGKSAASSPSVDKCNYNFENFKFVPNVNVADEKTKPTRLTSDNTNSTNVLCSNIVSETKLQTLSERLQKFNTSGIFSSSLIDRVKSAACSQSLDESNYNVENFKFIPNANVFADEQAKSIRLASDDANSTNLTEMCPTSIDPVPSPKSTECKEMMQPVAYKVTDAIKTVSEPTEYANECITETIIYPTSSVDGFTYEQSSQSNPKLQPEGLKTLESTTPAKKSDNLCEEQPNQSNKMLQIEGSISNVNKSIDITRKESTFSVNVNEWVAVPFLRSNVFTNSASAMLIDSSELDRIPLPPVAFKVNDANMSKDAINTVSEQTEYACEFRAETIIYPTSSVDDLNAEQSSQSNPKLQPEVLKTLESTNPAEKSDGLCEEQPNQSNKMLQIEESISNDNKSVDLTRIESTFSANVNELAAVPFPSSNLCTKKASDINIDSSELDRIPLPPVALKVTDANMSKDAIKTVSEQTEYANDCRTETVIYPTSSVDGLTAEQSSQSNQKLQPEVLKTLESATPSKKSDGLCKGQPNRSIKILQIEGSIPNVNKSVDVTRIESTLSANVNELAAVPFPSSNLCTKKASAINVDPSALSRIPLSEKSRHRVQPRLEDDIVARDIKEFPTTPEKKYECLPDANECSAVPATRSTLSYALETTNDVKVQSPKMAGVSPPQGSSLCHQDDFEDVIFLGVVNKCTTPSGDDRSQIESNLQCMNHLSKSDVQSGEVDQSRPLACMRLACPVTGGSNENLPPNRRSSSTRRSLNRCETVDPVYFPFVFGRNQSDVSDVITEEIYKQTVKPFLSKLSDGFFRLFANKFTSPELGSCRHCVDAKLISPVNALRHFLSKKHFISTYHAGFVFSFSRDFIKLTEICKENVIKKNKKVRVKIPIVGKVKLPIVGKVKLPIVGKVKLPFVGGYLPVLSNKIPFAKIYDMIICLKTRGVLTPSFENFVLQKFPRVKKITRCSHCNLSLPTGGGCSIYFSHFLTIEHIVKAMVNLYDCTNDWGDFTCLLRNYSEKIRQPRIYAQMKEDVRGGLYSKSSATYAGFAAQLKSTKK